MALHRAKEAILITDDTLRTQFANKATERLLNMKLVSLVSRVSKKYRIFFKQENYFLG